MHSEKIEQQVVFQEIALDSYLSTLLEEIPNEISDNQVDENKVIPETIKKDELLVTKEKTAVSINKDQVVKQASNANNITINKVNHLSVMPEWTQHEFQALFFKVDQLILAVPLTELLRTIKIEKDPTKIPGQPSWVLGLLDVLEQKIAVLDTGQLIFGKSKGEQRDLENQPFKSILITYDGMWGLACDEILSIGKLNPEKVRWRTLRQKKPWLLGTVIEELTTIIDVNQLVPKRKSA